MTDCLKLLQSFIRSFACSFVPSCTRSFIRSLLYWSVHSFIHTFSACCSTIQWFNRHFAIIHPITAPILQSFHVQSEEPSRWNCHENLSVCLSSQFPLFLDVCVFLIPTDEVQFSSSAPPTTTSDRLTPVHTNPIAWRRVIPWYSLRLFVMDYRTTARTDHLFSVMLFSPAVTSRRKAICLE